MSIIPGRPPRQFGARRKGDVRDIIVSHKVKRNAVFLGSGRFTNAFLHGRDVYLFTHYGDFSKEILWHCNEGKRNPHVPVIERIDVLDGPRGTEWDVYVYRSVLYEMPLKATSGKAWSEHRELARVRDEAQWRESGKRFIDTDRCHNINYYVCENAKVSESTREALAEIADRARDYGDNYLFDDFRPRNLGLDKRGRLVFVDPVFDAEIINADAMERRRRRNNYAS